MQSQVPTVLYATSRVINQECCLLFTKPILFRTSQMTWGVHRKFTLKDAFKYLYVGTKLDTINIK